MTVPKPEQFNRSVATSYAKIRQRLQDLPALYVWAYESGLTAKVGESAGKVTSSEVADPTGAIGFDHPKADRVHAHAHIRRALERVPRHMADAENALAAAEKEIMAAMDKLDPREGFEPLRFPVTASNADLEEAREAQAKRANGTGTG